MTFKTEIPTTLLDLVASKQISPASFTVYAFLKASVQPDGTVVTNRFMLSQNSGLSLRAISKAKRELSQQFKQLGNRPLVQIERLGNIKKNDVHTRGIASTETGYLCAN